jgi:type IV pilus assembly protein PilC
MAEFLVKVADERGHLLQQVENGFSESEIRDRFEQQGFLVYWVKPRGILSGGDFKLRRNSKVKKTPFLIYNQQFLTLIKAGLPILSSLDLLIKRQKDAQFRSLLQNVRDRVKGGELLSDAFAAQRVFPRIYTATLLAGEKSGNMEEVLSRYIAFQRLALTFKKKLAVSLVYPALLVTVVFTMLIFLVTYVVPQFAKLYENLGAQLPTITLIMLAVGNNAQRYAPFFVVGAVLFMVALWRWKNTDRGADRIDRIILALPLLGREFFAHAFDAPYWRHAAGVVAGDCRRFHEQPPHPERCFGGCDPGPRRSVAGSKPGRTKDVSRLVGGDD